MKKFFFFFLLCFWQINFYFFLVKISFFFSKHSNRCVILFILFKSFQGEDTVEYFLGLTPSGIIVLRNKTKVGNYFW